MSPSQATSAPRHDGKVLLVADQGLQSAERMTPAQVDRKVDDFWTGIGGAGFFQALTTRFYELVAEDEVLSPLFAVPDWSRHAARLYDHFRRIYGENDLTAAWDPKMHRAHAHFLISREQRLRWLALMKEAGTQLNAPEPHFGEFLTIMVIASGEMTAVSRGAALARGERFHWDGTPA
jgi:truncated hemoglobin YjbI